MKIFRAIKTNFITQGFYENLIPIYQEWGLKYHGGVDFLANDNEPIYFDCSIAGFVLNTEIDNNGGLGINIITENEDGIFKHRYWHLKSFKVKAGDKVESGDLLGYADNTGYSTGTHLHRDVKEMVKNENGSYKIKYPDNGTYGTIDFTKWFTNMFIKEYINNLNSQISIYQKIIELFKQFLKVGIK
jgi:murein DD-endopeptidase MepM/ murein hydrolase activator NlpD